MSGATLPFLLYTFMVCTGTLLLQVAQVQGQSGQKAGGMVMQHQLQYKPSVNAKANIVVLYTTSALNIHNNSDGFECLVYGMALVTWLATT